MKDDIRVYRFSTRVSSHQLGSKHICNTRQPLVSSWCKLFQIACIKYETYFGNSTVTIPFGCISTLLPQNLSFGCIEPWNIQLSQSAWNAETGGWWLTCSQIMWNSGLSNSYVSPSSGLKGLPKRSQLDAKALTAKPANIIAFVFLRIQHEKIENTVFFVIILWFK